MVNYKEILDDKKIVTLDYSNSKHYNFIKDWYGGEEKLKGNFPLVHHLMENTKAKHLAEGGTTYKTLLQIDNPQRWEDGVYIGYLILDPKTKVLDGQVSASFNSEQLSIQTAIKVYLDGNEVFSQSDHNTNTSFIDFNFSFLNPEGYTGEEHFEVVVESTHVTLENELKTQFLLSDESSIYLNNSKNQVVKSFDTKAPIHIKTQQDQSIHISIGRGQMPKETIDYEFPKSFNLQLPFESIIQLENNLNYLGYDVSSCSYIVNSKLGMYQYNLGFEGIITPNPDSNQFTIKPQVNWGIPLHPEKTPLVEPASVTFKVNIVYSEPSVNNKQETLFISNIKPNIDPIPSNYKLIPAIEFYFGCLGKDTEIKMEGNQLKKISEIVAGDKVLNSEGEIIKVQAVSSGYEETITCIDVSEGNIILATGQHPFETKRGFVPAMNLKVNDELLLQDGTYSKPRGIYLREYEDQVYNLILECKRDEKNTMIANGFVVGDNAKQNSVSDDVRQAQLERQISPELKQEIEEITKMFNA